MSRPALGDRPARWPHELAAEPAPDARLPPLRAIESLATRRARLAEAALARARHAQALARQALEAARQALDERVSFVASERARLVVERQNSVEASTALKRWREADQQLINSIPPCRALVAQRQQALEAADLALVRAQDEHRKRSKRREKFDMLIDTLIEEA
ncbi:hypothetical protein OU995_10970 [Roseateles sp. SL47]|jgi:hypothetical protein|uniref:hypothetical protein n=1 Tax=Roseateles sp. SL47 TaxID=2995138 RepID=UPI00226FAB0C|nr:hypothetical protein [Roseateles sp. SL47]WAC75182.1 hypothetical protein OU995_10970 [Roseateles sp. SL47]